MQKAPRKTQTFAASLLVLALGLPASVHPESIEGYALRREALRAPAAPQSSGLEQLDRTLRAAAGAEEERVSLEEATRRILSNSDEARRVWFENETFSFFSAGNWPSEEETRKMLGQMMKAHGDTDTFFISLRNVLEQKTLWVRAASVPPNLLAYHQRLADRINAEGLFHVSLLRDGSIFLFSFPEGKHSFFGTEYVYLLHYDSHAGLFFVHTRSGEIGQYDLQGNKAHSLIPGGIFQAPGGNAQIPYADRVYLIDTLLEAGGVEKIEFDDLLSKDPLKIVDKYMSFMDVTLPGTATLHLKNGSTVLLHVMRGALSIDHVGPAAGAEEVRRIGAEEFFGEYHPALKTLPPSRKDEIFKWMDYPGFEIREVILPDRVALYVRGKELIDELTARIGNPPGVSFDWKLLPLKPGEGWERVGLILNDLGRQGFYDLDNPNGLRVHDVGVGEAAQLNAALLLAEALATLPPGSVLLGAELLPDTRGRVHLILFSA